jgi:hypothetical protein
MNIFEYLIYLGIIQLLYSFIFQWISMALAMLMIALRIKTWGMYLVKTLNLYLYVSILGVLTVFALQDNTSIISLLLFTVVGLFFAFSTIGGGMYQGYKEASQSGAYDALEAMKYDTYFLYGSLIYFIVVLFVPSLATTLPVQLLFSLISWVYSLPIIGFLLGIFGVFSMLGTFFQAIVMGGAGVAILFGKFRNNKKKIVDDNVSAQTNMEITEKIENDILYCSHCGKEIDENAEFCKYCGKKIDRK